MVRYQEIANTSATGAKTPHNRAISQLGISQGSSSTRMARMK